MPFIGDHGWFYLSARDMLVTGKIPLVGITSSHVWLHQGPVWTYLLAGVLFLFGFHPMSGAYLTNVLGITTLLLIYKVGSELFSKNVGMIASFLYATSPLIVMSDRTPYHTSPIPLFTLIFMYALCKWIKGGIIYFPLIMLSLAVLYNFELATSVLWFIFLPLLGFGLWKKKVWATNVLKPKIILFSLLALTLPMVPIFVYDLSHGFSQTVKFTAWIAYRTATLSFAQRTAMLDFFSHAYQRLIFMANGFTALVIGIASLTWFIKKSIPILLKKVEDAHAILFLLIVVPLSGFFVNQTPSEAYLPIFFPTIILVTALFLTRLFLRNRTALLIIMAISLSNSSTLIANDYLMGKSPGYGAAFIDRMAIASSIVHSSKGKMYNLIGKGEGSEFETFTMNYEYLTWWLGHPPAKMKGEIRFVIEERNGKIYLEKELFEQEF